MKPPAGMGHGRINSILTPFVQYRNDWLFHYPVYLNTFCFTYHLAQLLSRAARTGGPDALGGNFRRHDWSGGLPQFSYGRDIEIFVAVRSMIDQARLDGHDIPMTNIVRFTRYNIKRVFTRNRQALTPPPAWLLVTDLPQNGPELVTAWKTHSPRWLKQLGKIELDKLDKENMRLSTRRELSDLFESHGKIYLFSAPLAHVLRQQSNKYVERPANINPIDTYFVFRCNSGVDLHKVVKLRAAISAYYGLLFRSGSTQRYLYPDVAQQYGRIASTVGQPHPFPEIHLSGTLSTAIKSNMLQRYADILIDHHHPLNEAIAGIAKWPRLHQVFRASRHARNRSSDITTSMPAKQGMRSSRILRLGQLARQC